MYARVFDCALQTVARTEFNNILRDQVLPVLKNEPGFVDLIGFVSEDQPDHAQAPAHYIERPRPKRLLLVRGLSKSLWRPYLLGDNGRRGFVPLPPWNEQERIAAEFHLQRDSR